MLFEGLVLQIHIGRGQRRQQDLPGRHREPGIAHGQRGVGRDETARRVAGEHDAARREAEIQCAAVGIHPVLDGLFDRGLGRQAVTDVEHLGSGRRRQFGDEPAM